MHYIGKAAWQPKEQSFRMAIFKIGNGESANRGMGTGNGESLKRGIFKMGNLLNGESLKRGILKSGIFKMRS